MGFCVAAACSLWLVFAVLVWRAKDTTTLAVQIALAITGIPVLGGLTYWQGPLAGLLGLCFGALVLCRHSLPWRCTPQTSESE